MAYSLPSRVRTACGHRLTSVSRGQLEPTAALVATAAVCLSLGLYAVALGNAVPTGERDLAEPTLDRVAAELSEGGTVVPADRHSALATGPEGYRTNLTIETPARHWHAGPPVPARADRAHQQTSVRTGPDRVRTGTLRVAIWA